MSIKDRLYIVRCSYCRTQGHNKRGCSRFKLDSEDPALPWVRPMAAPKVRRCSYCALAGHDRRKCTQLHDDKIGAVLANRKWIQLIIADMEANGVGVGTILKMNPRAFVHEGRFAIAMVTGFNWYNLFLPYPTRSWIRVKYFAGNEEGINGSKPWYNFGTEGHFSFKDCHYPTESAETMDWENMELSKSLAHSNIVQIISPTRNRNLKASVPKNISLGGYGVEEWFKDKCAKDYYVNKAKHIDLDSDSLTKPATTVRKK